MGVLGFFVGVIVGVFGGFVVVVDVWVGGGDVVDLIEFWYVGLYVYCGVVEFLVVGDCVL